MMDRPPGGSASALEADLRAKDAERQFDVVVESVKDYAIFMLDASVPMRTRNAGAELIKGYRAEEVIGRHMSVFYTEADRALGKPQSLLATARAEGR